MAAGNFGTLNSGFGQRAGKQRIIVLVLIVLILVLSIALVLILQSKKSEASSQNTNVEEVIDDSATITLYTPAKNIEAGTKFSDVELKEVFWPKNSLPEGAVISLTDLSGKYAKTKMTYGEPITAAMIGDSPPEPEVITIRPGMRAVTIEISSKRSVEGWALPGSRVDVVLTHLDEGRLSSKVVVENARILSAGGDISTAKERLLAGKREIKASPTVTLELNPTDALKIETAQQLGNLSLHLRAPEDNQSGGVDSIDQSNLSNSKKDPECNKGKIRVAGKEYWMACDGKLIEVK